MIHRIIFLITSMASAKMPQARVNSASTGNIESGCKGRKCGTSMDLCKRTTASSWPVALSASTESDAQETEMVLGQSENFCSPGWAVISNITRKERYGSCGVSSLPNQQHQSCLLSL